MILFIEIIKEIKLNQLINIIQDTTLQIIIQDIIMINQLVIFIKISP
jgi:hypothetical protein